MQQPSVRRALPRHGAAAAGRGRARLPVLSGQRPRPCRRHPARLRLWRSPGLCPAGRKLCGAGGRAGLCVRSFAAATLRPFPAARTPCGGALGGPVQPALYPSGSPVHPAGIRGSPARFTPATIRYGLKLPPPGFYGMLINSKIRHGAAHSRRRHRGLFHEKTHLHLIYRRHHRHDAQRTGLCAQARLLCRGACGHSGADQPGHAGLGAGGDGPAAGLLQHHGARVVRHRAGHCEPVSSVRRLRGAARHRHHGLHRLGPELHAGKPGQAGGAHRQPDPAVPAAQRRTGQSDHQPAHCRRGCGERGEPLFRRPAAAGQPGGEELGGRAAGLLLPQLSPAGHRRGGHPLQQKRHRRAPGERPPAAGKAGERSHRRTEGVPRHPVRAVRLDSDRKAAGHRAGDLWRRQHSGLRRRTAAPDPEGLRPRHHSHGVQPVPPGRSAHWYLRHQQRPESCRRGERAGHDHRGRCSKAVLPVQQGLRPGYHQALDGAGSAWRADQRPLTFFHNASKRPLGSFAKGSAFLSRFKTYSSSAFSSVSTMISSALTRQTFCRWRAECARGPSGCWSFAASRPLPARRRAIFPGCASPHR